MRGPMLPLGGEPGNLDFLRQLPGGYALMNILRTVMRKFPGSRTGVGCGVGAGFGIGIGFAPAGSGGLGSMGAMGGMGRMSGMSGMSGMGTFRNTAGGQQQGSGQYVPNSTNSIHPGSLNAGGALPNTASSVPESRIKALEDKVQALEDRIGMQLKLKELEQRLSEVEQTKRRR